jgi:hypothetical protein
MHLWGDWVGHRFFANLHILLDPCLLKAMHSSPLSSSQSPSCLTIQSRSQPGPLVAAFLGLPVWA